MSTVDEKELISTARELGPLIREHAEEAERERRPSKAVMDALKDAGLQRMYTPRSLGGHEVDPVTYARVAEEIASHDSVAGWALQTGNHMAWWVSRLPDEGVEKIYANGPDALIAGAFHPPLPAAAADGGYHLSGQAPLASNIHDADWLNMSGMVMDGDQPRMQNGAPVILAVFFPADEAKIIDTWDALGMRGTDSNDLAAEEVFIPSSRTFAMAPEFELGKHYQGPLYKFPAMGAVMTIFTPVLLAMGRGALDEFRGLAMEKTPLGFNRTLRERPVVQAALARAEAMFRAARTYFYDSIAQAWERTKAGRTPTLEEKADLLLAGTHASNTAAKVTEMMHGLAGTSGIYTGSRLERHFRDAHTLRHHGLISANRFETAGQVQLGVAPEFPLVAL